MRALRCVALGLAFSAGACSQPTSPQRVAAVAQPVVYGDDDRVEFDALDGGPWLSVAVARAVALIPTQPAVAPVDPTEPTDDAGTESEDAGTEPEPRAATAADRFALCPEERFAEQPSLADCSGVLIADDLVLTAGHCFDSADGCDRYQYALGYEAAAFGDGGVAPRMARCGELLIRELGSLADGSRIDYALIRLAAAPDGAGRAGQPVASAQSLQPATVVTTVGFPVGLPLKIDPAGQVRAVNRTGFTLQTDTYLGSSGSAVYDTSGQLTGLISSGEQDFVWDRAARCNRSRVVAADDREASEVAMHAWVAIARACHRLPELTLCAVMPETDAPEVSEPMPETSAPNTEPVDAGAAYAGAQVDKAAAAADPIEPAPDAAITTVSKHTAQSPPREDTANAGPPPPAPHHPRRSTDCSAALPAPSQPKAPLLLYALAAFIAALVRRREPRDARRAGPRDPRARRAQGPDDDAALMHLSPAAIEGYSAPGCVRTWRSLRRPP